MLKNLWTTFQNLAKSRKFLLAVISGIVYVGGRFGLQLDELEVMKLVGPFWAGIVGVTWEDVAAKKANAVQLGQLVTELRAQLAAAIAAATPATTVTTNVTAPAAAAA